MPTPAELLAEARRKRQAGDRQRAADLCKQALRIDPSHGAALHLLAEIAAEQGQTTAALDLAARAAASDSTSADYRLTHATFLLLSGQPERATEAFRDVVRLRPESFEGWLNLGVALDSVGQPQEGAAAMERAIAVQPDREEGYANRAQLARRRGRLSESIEILRRAIARGVSGPRVYNNLGSSLRLLGQVDEAVDAFRKSLELDPRFPLAWHNYLYALLFHAGSGPEQIAEAQQRWASIFTDPLKSTHRPHGNDPSPDRRLRIGYVSPNFKNHPVGVFMEPILAGHDRSQVEVYCYADGDGEEDARAKTLRRHADVWRDVRRIDSAGLAELICRDRIDVLVDLNQHMGGSKLLAFARRPAPVQVAYLGYAASTGLAAIDYRLGDPHLDPPGTETVADVEHVVRMPETYWCYRPHPGATDVTDPPCLKNGYPTFGSFNAAAKINPQVVSVWSQLLRMVPNARLLVMLSGIDESDPHWRQLFAHHGIKGDRLRFVGYRPYLDYLRSFSEVDVALDPFPYNGGTTTLDGLWMGVPTVTLAGRSGVSRAGASILNNAGLPDLVATTAEEYVAIAANLAEDLTRLRDLRLTLRARLRQSPLMNEARFVHQLEETYRGMWRRWCVTAAVGSDPR
jgi:protein O-GlcNAc transferase